MRVELSGHARGRLEKRRQDGITVHDIVTAAASFPGRISKTMRLRGFRAASGRSFDLVVIDKKGKRKVVTVIGK